MTRKQIINSFKENFGSLANYVAHVQQNGKTTVRCEFISWVDYLRKDNQITNYQAQNTVASDKELFDIKINL